MRTLKFNVDRQIITKDGDFENLIAGTCGYLQARFQFSADWIGMKKIVTFTANGKDTYVPLFEDCCQIPVEVLQYNKIAVSVEGRNKERKLVTNGVEFTQVGGKA